MSEKYRQSLSDYLHFLYPTFSDVYISYCVDEAIGEDGARSDALIVIDDNEKIVGCHLCFNTKALVAGKLENVVWGHDTFLDEGYRKYVGLDFVLKISSIRNGVGYGLTDKNIKIQKRLRAVFVKGIRQYHIALLKRLPFALLVKGLKIVGINYNKPFIFPNKLSVKGNLFSLCYSPREINIPNNGFWNKDYWDVDFIRDEEFLNKRFFNNPVNHYYVYSFDEGGGYVVVRPTVFKGLPCIVIADFRYDMSRPELARIIFKAVKIICRRGHFVFLSFITSDPNVMNIFKDGPTIKSYPVAFVGGKNWFPTPETSVMVTLSDSDGEFRL